MVYNFRRGKRLELRYLFVAFLFVFVLIFGSYVAYQNLGKREIVGNVISEPNNLNYDLERKSVLDFESGYHVSNGDLSGKEIKKFLDVLDNNVDETSESDLIKIEENNQSQGIIVELSEEPAAEVTNSLTYKTKLFLYNLGSTRELKAVPVEERNAKYKEFFSRGDIKEMFRKQEQKVVKQQKDFASRLRGQKDFASNSKLRLAPESSKNNIEVKEIAKAVANMLYLPDLEYNEDNIKKLKELGAKNVYPNTRYEAILDESVPMIGAPEVWALSDNLGRPLDGTGTVVAVIDTGVDYTHPDLGGCLGEQCKVVGGYDFINEDSDPMDDHGHGTHVASTVAGINDRYLGVAPGAGIMAYKVLDSGGSGGLIGIARAIEASLCGNKYNFTIEGDEAYLGGCNGDYSDHVDVISMSLGGSGDPDDGLSRIVDRASSLGVISSIAAGNSGPEADTIGSPGTARTAVTVAAACKIEQIGNHPQCLRGEPIADFSSRGPLIWNGEDLRKPDISAPGVGICAARLPGLTLPNPVYGLCGEGETHIYLSGTSMATPHVSGALAIIRQAFPELAPFEIKDAMKNSAIDLGMDYDLQGAGLINLPSTLREIDPFIEIQNNSLSINPIFKLINVKPQTRFFQGSFLINVKNIEGHSIRLLRPTLSNLEDGLTVNVDEFLDEIKPLQSVSVNVSYSLDLNTLKQGRREIFLAYTLDGKTQGVKIIFNLLSSISLDKSSLEIVFDDILEKGGYSESVKYVNLSNSRIDGSEYVKINLTGLSEKNISFDYPKEVLIPPASSVLVPIKIIINSSLLSLRGKKLDGEVSFYLKGEKIFKSNWKALFFPNYIIKTDDRYFYEKYVSVSLFDKTAYEFSEDPPWPPLSLIYIDGNGVGRLPILSSNPAPNFDAIISGPVFKSGPFVSYYPDTYLFFDSNLDYGKSANYTFHINRSKLTKSFYVPQVSADSGARMSIDYKGLIYGKSQGDKKQVYSLVRGLFDGRNTVWHFGDFPDPWESLVFVGGYGYNKYVYYPNSTSLKFIEFIPFSFRFDNNDKGNLSLSVKESDFKNATIKFYSENFVNGTISYVEPKVCVISKPEGLSTGFGSNDFEEEQFVNFVDPLGGERCNFKVGTFLVNGQYSPNVSYINGYYNYNFRYLPGNYNLASDAEYEDWPYLKFFLGSQNNSEKADQYKSPLYFLTNEGIVEFNAVRGYDKYKGIFYMFPISQSYNSSDILKETVLRKFPFSSPITIGKSPLFFSGQVGYTDDLTFDTGSGKYNFNPRLKLIPYNSPSFWNKQNRETVYGNKLPNGKGTFSYVVYSNQNQIFNDNYSFPFGDSSMYIDLNADKDNYSKYMVNYSQSYKFVSNF